MTTTSEISVNDDIKIPLERSILLKHDAKHVECDKADKDQAKLEAHISSSSNIESNTTEDRAVLLQPWDYLIVLHLITTGKQNEDLGSDETPIMNITVSIFDLTDNKMRIMEQIKVKPMSRIEYLTATNGSGKSTEEISIELNDAKITQINNEETAIYKTGINLSEALDKLNCFLIKEKIFKESISSHDSLNAQPADKKACVMVESALPLRLVLHPEASSKAIDLTPYPFLFEYFDLQKAFAELYSTEKSMTINEMIENLEMNSSMLNDFGLSQCQDMIQIVHRMLKDGYQFNHTEKINQHYLPAIIRKSDHVDDDVVVRARGLPWQATDSDINRFFRGLNIADGGIALVLSVKGRRNGEALIRFTNREQRDLALRKHKHHMGQRYIEVYMANGRDFIAIAGGESEEAAKFLEKFNRPNQTLIRMRGLPYTTTPQQILDFFNPPNLPPTQESPTDLYETANDESKASVDKDEDEDGHFEFPQNTDGIPVEFGEEGILFVNHLDGKATGDAFVIFANEKMGEKALLSHRKNIGPRYIELFKSTPAEVNQVFNTMVNPPSPVSNSNFFLPNAFLLPPINSSHLDNNLNGIASMATANQILNNLLAPSGNQFGHQSSNPIAVAAVHQQAALATALASGIISSNTGSHHHANAATVSTSSSANQMDFFDNLIMNNNPNSASALQLFGLTNQFSNHTPQLPPLPPPSNQIHAQPHHPGSNIIPPHPQNTSNNHLLNSGNSINTDQLYMAPPPTTAQPPPATPHHAAAAAAIAAAALQQSSQHPSSCSSAQYSFHHPSQTNVQQINVNILNNGFNNSGGHGKCFLQLKGMPLEATVADVLNFLETHSNYIVLQGVHLVYNTLGQSAGEAIIQMISEAAATAAMQEKNRAFFYVVSGGTYKRSQISITTCSSYDITQFISLPPPSGGINQVSLANNSIFPIVQQQQYSNASLNNSCLGMIKTTSHQVNPGAMNPLSVATALSPSTIIGQGALQNIPPSSNGFGEQIASLNSSMISLTGSNANISSSGTAGNAPKNQGTGKNSHSAAYNISLASQVPAGSADLPAISNMNKAHGMGAAQILPAIAPIYNNNINLKGQSTGSGLPSIPPPPPNSIFPNGFNANPIMSAAVPLQQSVTPGNPFPITVPFYFAAPPATTSNMFYLSTNQLQQSTVIVKGLPKDALLEEILAVFEAIVSKGIIPDVKVGLNQEGQTTGEAFITFPTREDAIRAIQECNYKVVRSEPIELILAGYNSSPN